MSLADDVYGSALYLLNRPGCAPEERMLSVLNLLAKYRAETLGSALAHKSGMRVRSGPFSGMVLAGKSAEGCFTPKLLGCYEAELHGVVERIVSRGYSTIVNVGCAEGYYAVGLALRLPRARVFAFDIDDGARESCARAAELNGVAGRVSVGGELDHAGLARFDAGTLLICDIEGAEKRLLDPEAAPVLRGMDMLIETHPVFEPGCDELIRTRFAPTHQIEHIAPAPHAQKFDELVGLDQLDRLLAVWEWRLRGNDWLWLTVNDEARRSRT